MPLEDALPDYLKSTFDASVNGALPLVGFVSRGGRQGDWSTFTGLDMARRLEIAESLFWASSAYLLTNLHLDAWGFILPSGSQGRRHPH